MYILLFLVAALISLALVVIGIRQLVAGRVGPGIGSIVAAVIVMGAVMLLGGAISRLGS